MQKILEYLSGEREPINLVLAYYPMDVFCTIEKSDWLNCEVVKTSFSILTLDNEYHLVIGFEEINSVEGGARIEPYYFIFNEGSLKQLQEFFSLEFIESIFPEKP